MEFFKNLDTDDFKEFIGMIILLCVMAYLSLPLSYTDPSIRGSMQALLVIIVKYYFDKTTKSNV